MEVYEFDNIEDVLLAIKEKKYNRSFASIIGLSYMVDEREIGGYLFDFNEDKLCKYSFLFYFFDVGQIGVSDENFKSFIEKILLLEPTSIEPVEIKKILYEKELNELKDKLDKKHISNEVYEKQVGKYLD